MPDILKQLADNPDLFNAVKAVLVRQFDLDGLSTQLADESLGQVVRARLEGLRKVEEGFAEILKHRTVPKSVVPDNPAR